jgi:hypothetical protein
MSKQPETERRYSDKELALILKLAAERQVSSSRTDEAGLTLAEIQQIAADAGIDPQHVTEAAAALEGQYGREWPSLLGAPTKYVFERTIGGKVPERELSDLIEVIRRVLGIQGEVSQVFDTVEWRGKDNMDRHTYVTIKSQQGQTKIKVFGHWWGPALLSYILTGAGGLLATIGLVGSIGPTSPLGIGACIAAGIAGTYLTARTIWQYIARGSESKLRRLANQLQEAATATVATEPPARVEERAQQLPDQSEEITPERPREAPRQRA